jgi:histidine ammonia-lyase
MGTIAARKAMKIVENVRNVLAIELLCATQAIDLRRAKMGRSTKLGKGTQVVYELVRKQVPQIVEDRILSDDVKTLAKLIDSGQLARAVEEWVGELM